MGGFRGRPRPRSGPSSGDRVTLCWPARGMSRSAAGDWPPSERDANPGIGLCTKPGEEESVLADSKLVDTRGRGVRLRVMRRDGGRATGPGRGCGTGSRILIPTFWASPHSIGRLETVEAPIIVARGGAGERGSPGLGRRGVGVVWRVAAAAWSLGRLHGGSGDGER